MIDLAALLDPRRLAELVPEAYARYRPAIAEGLLHFLDGLPPARMAAILADQLALPATAGAARRLVALARHSPALHKLGQVLARDQRLPHELRALLQTLETMPPRLDAATVAGMVAAELGRPEALGFALDGPPLAEASVAIVTPIRWHATPGSAPHRGVLKLLKPGIEEALADDLVRLEALGVWLDAACARHGLPAIAYAQTFARVRLLLAGEVRLTAEQEHLRAARAALAQVHGVVVPELLPWCTGRVTAMERLDGRKVTEAAHLPPSARRRLAASLIEALLAAPIWSPAEAALFHGDPHAGNLMLLEDGRVALLDWSLAARLDRNQREGLTRLLLAACLLDGAAVAASVAGLAVAPPAAARLAPVVAAALADLARGEPLGLAWLTRLLDAAALEGGVDFPAELLLFRKSLFTMSGVVAELAPDLPLDAVLAEGFLGCLATELPTAWWRPFAAPAPGSHLSSADLSRAVLSLPLVGQRAWLLRIASS
ncbi:MAG: AarF/UbiB family protein [Geminicoccaceae bacterium]